MSLLFPLPPSWPPSVCSPHCVQIDGSWVRSRCSHPLWWLPSAPRTRATVLPQQAEPQPIRSGSSELGARLSLSPVLTLLGWFSSPAPPPVLQGSTGLRAFAVAPPRRVCLSLPETHKNLSYLLPSLAKYHLRAALPDRSFGNCNSILHFCSAHLPFQPYSSPIELATIWYAYLTFELYCLAPITRRWNPQGRFCYWCCPRVGTSEYLLNELWRQV